MEENGLSRKHRSACCQKQNQESWSKGVPEFSWKLHEISEWQPSAPEKTILFYVRWLAVACLPVACRGRPRALDRAILTVQGAD
jgi:hypothetical protein